MAVRHIYITDPDEGHPWQTDPARIGLDKWYIDYSAEELITRFHEEAACIFAERAGIRLRMHSIVPFENADIYRMNSRVGPLNPGPGYWTERRVHQKAIAPFWRRGQPYINVVWVRARGKLDTGVYEYPHQAFDARYHWFDYEYEWEPSFGVLLHSNTELELGIDFTQSWDNGDPVVALGGILAHELGHILGLPHSFRVWDNDIAELEPYYSPFPFDLDQQSTEDRDRNMMNYYHSNDYEYTVDDNVPADEVTLTQSQRNRLRLTMFRRSSHFNRQHVTTTAPDEVGADGYRSIPPDYISELHAAWLN